MREGRRIARAPNATGDHSPGTQSCSCPVLLQPPPSTSNPKPGKSLIQPVTRAALAKANT